MMYVYISVTLVIILWKLSQDVTKTPFNIINGQLLPAAEQGWPSGDRDNDERKKFSIYPNLNEKIVSNLAASTTKNDSEARNASIRGNNMLPTNNAHKHQDKGSGATNAQNMLFKFSREDEDILRKHAVTIHRQTSGVDRKANIDFNFKNGNDSERKTVIATVASYDIRNMVYNLICFVEQSTEGATPVLFSLDIELTLYASKHNIPSIAFHSSAQVKSANETYSKLKHETIPQRKNLDGEPAFWGTQEFSGISNNKLVIVYHLLKLGYDVLLTDVDVVWCRDMLPIFARYVNDYPDFDIFMQSNRAAENGTGQLNTGFYYAKATEGVVSLFESLASKSPEAILKGQDDQTFFWGHTCRAGHVPTDQSFTGVIRYEVGRGGWKTICQWNGKKVVLLFLPLADFPNGAVRFRKYNRLDAIEYSRGISREMCRRKEVAIWHVNYVQAHMKKAVLNRNGLWISRANGTCETI